MKRALPLAVAMFMLVPLAVTGQPSTGEVNQEILSKEGQDITFYGHLFDIMAENPMPMNTQFPDGANDYSRGEFGACGYRNGVPIAAIGNMGLGSNQADVDCFSYPANEVYFYTTAGFVQVKDANDHAYNKYHNERGQTKDIYFDTDKQPSVTFYMSADFHGWSSLFSGFGAGWNWDPGMFEDWTIEASIYHASLGDWSSDPDAKPDMGPIVAEEDTVTLVARGRSEPVDMYSFDSTIPAPQCEGECRTVHPFSVDLDWTQEFLDQDGVVPYLNDLIIKVEWFQQTGDDIYIMTPGVAGGYAVAWNVNAGEDFPPTFVLPTRNPLDVELVFPRFVHDKLVVLSVLNTPWGSYDVDLESIDLEIRKANGQVVEPKAGTLQEFIDVSVAHSGHYDPINITWIWDYQDQGLSAGDYELVVSASNFQGSYTTETIATFSITKEGTGGDATAGQSGILTFTNEQFRQYQEGAVVDDESEGADPDSEAGEAKGTPGFGALAALGAALAVARRRP